MLRSSFRRSVIVLGMLGTGSALNAQAPSLADIARQEQERRGIVNGPSKLYTNADLSPAEHPTSFVALVTGVVDGDTIAVTAPYGRDILRFHGVDAPERGQPYFIDAIDFTRSLVMDQIVTVTGLYRDPYGRLVSRVSSQVKDVNLELVKAGLAWHDTEYSSDATLAAAEQAARRARLGLWIDPDPVPPSVARRPPPPQHAPTPVVTADSQSSGRTGGQRDENDVPSESTPVEPIANGDLWWQSPVIIIPIGPTCGVNTPRQQALSNAIRLAAGLAPGGSGQPCIAPAPHRK